MNVRILTRTPIMDRLALLRTTPLENVPNGHKIYPLREASMRLDLFFPAELDLSSRYYIHDKLAFQRSLRRALLRDYGIDTLMLTDALQLEIDGAVGELDVIPPIVEIYEEKASFGRRSRCRRPPEGFIPRQMRFLHDGMHRSLLALQERRPLCCIVLEGADHRRYLPYTYPNGWGEVRGYDAVPPMEEKKHFRWAGESPYLYMPPFRVLWTTGANESPTQYGRQ